MTTDNDKTINWRGVLFHFIFGAVLGALSAVIYMTGMKTIHVGAVVISAVVVGILAAVFGCGFWRAVRRWFGP